MKNGYEQILQTYPATVSLEQVRKICHISKRKGKWLLEHGVIPCSDTGKKTRRFTVKTKDIVSYLMKLDNGAVELAVPVGAFSSCKPKHGTVYPAIDKADFGDFLMSRWGDVDDVLSTAQISDLLGYSTATIRDWTKDDLLPCIVYHGEKRILKESLVSFLAERINRSVASMSSVHKDLRNEYLEQLNDQQMELTL